MGVFATLYWMLTNFCAWVMGEPCHIWTVILHIKQSWHTNSDESCHIYECISLLNVDECLRLGDGWVLSHIWTSHVTQLNEFCRTSEYCHTVKESFRTYEWVTTHMRIERFKTSFAAESGQIRKNRTFSNLRGLKLCTSHIFCFWLFAWSRCGQIDKKSSRKDSWYQDYSVLLTSAPPSCHRQPSAFVPEIARNIWKQAASILVERTINQNIEVLLFW